MIDKFLQGTNFYDFPSFEVALFSIMLSFVLSTLIALTYRFTFKGARFPNHFFQAMILSSMATSMIIMAVGSNLAVGFGIIGAVAIIRFRTIIQDPRNVIFLFAAISVGIANGVYGYAIALAGSVIFCLVSILLYYSPFGSTDLELELAIFTLGDLNQEPSEFTDFCSRTELIKQRKMPEGVFRKDFILTLKKDYTKKQLFEVLSSNEVFLEVRLEGVSNNQL